MASESNVGYATLSIIPNALGFGAALSKGIAPQMATAGASGGAGLLGAIKKALPVAAVIAAVGTLAAIGNTFHDLTSTIRVGTGATGAALDALVASAKRVGQGTAASFEDVGKTVTALNVRLGLTGPVLETLSKQFLAAGRITKQALDLNTVTGSFNAFGITSKNMSPALDDLFRISQATGVGINELAAAATKGAPAFRQFGLSFADSAALVGVLDKAGINSGKTIMALTIGLTKFSKAGKAPGPALRETVKSIEAFTKSGNDAKAIALAAGIFGTRGAAQFVAAVKSGKVNLDDMMKSSGASGDSIMAAADAVSGLSGKWSKFMNNVLVMVEPVATRVFNALNGGMKILLDVGLPALQKFGAAFSEKVTPALTVFGGFITGTVVPAVKDFIKGFQDGTGAGGGFKDFLVLLYNDAVKPIGDFLVNTAIPAIKDFIKGFQDGTGPGGTFRDIVKKVYEEGIKPLATFITDTALPALKSIETWITTKGGPKLGELIKWFKDSKTALETVAIIITTVLLPVFADMAVKAVASAATQVTAWVSAQAAGATSAVTQFAAHYMVVAGWIASGAAAVASGAETVAIWAMLKWDAIGSAAATVAAHVSMAAAWVATKVVTLAGAAATGIATAAQWLWNAALTANPIGIVVMAIAALVAAIVLIATKTTWFQTIWEYMSGALGKAWQWLWNTILAPIIRFVLNGFGSITDGIASMLKVLSNIPGFGWAKTAADKMAGAAAQAHALANGIKDIPDKKNVTITVSASTVGNLASTYRSQVPKFASGGIVPATPGGRLVRVAEAGVDEAIVPLSNGRQSLNNSLGGPVDLSASTISALASAILAGAREVSARSTSAAQVSRTLAMAGGSR